MCSLQIYVPPIKKTKPFRQTTTYHSPRMSSPCIFLLLMMHEHCLKDVLFD
ncbi:hypothetical protein HMPREF1991_00889 [Hoylesella loescheii DSM 19665 = JCM 12249 = ATCC 15930]|uniref:Uncharacterized protein n=1 Tax=Hoylesella loescheii DSM 19665 = JCM 12249 = ATCC 15930 TaxID=1122985 RepID=A0A069QJJ2_HOYLO|nr:hypothetical protein HMPREF1991_00889 [Hoylesella loescheii DSM 19665 = JCM 12249 = ATCC 15930]